MRSLLAVVLSGLVAIALVKNAWAASNEVLLTVTSDEQSIEIKRDDIASLKMVTVTTETDWTDGPKVFRGPLVRDVLTFAGVTVDASAELSATAANDYSVDIPASDFEDYDVILAMEMDGKRLTLRDKGPLWIVYPRDDHSELRDPIVNSRWIWQLVQLGVK